MLFKVYSKQNCTYCEQAKNLLQKLELPFQVLSLEDNEWDKDTLEKQLQITIKTVPQITYGNIYVGGFNDLQTFVIENDMI